MDVDPNIGKGQSRRRFLGKTAIATGVVWSAPAILGTTQAFAQGSAGVPGTYCAPVTLPAPLNPIGPGPGGATALGAVNFGHGFSAITSVCFQTWFNGDLWDQGETYFITPAGSNSFGQNNNPNNAQGSQATAIVCVGQANLIALYYTGAFSFTYSGWVGSMTIERAEVCITGTPV